MKEYFVVLLGTYHNIQIRRSFAYKAESKRDLVIKIQKENPGWFITFFTELEG